MRTTVVGSTSAFLHRYKRSGRKADGIGAWKALLRKYEGGEAQRFYFLQQKLKQLKQEHDEDPDVLFQHLHEFGERFDEVDERISDRRLIDIFLDKLIPDYEMVRFNDTKDSENFGPHKAEHAPRQTWMRKIELQLQKRKSSTTSSPAGASGMSASPRKYCGICGRTGHDESTCWTIRGRPKRGGADKATRKDRNKKKWCEFYMSSSHDASESKSEH